MDTRSLSRCALKAGRYSTSPTALRASWRSKKMRMWLILPSIRSYTLVLRRCHANAAGSARGASAHEREHPLAIDLFHAVKLDPEIGCGFLDVRKETPDAVDSFVHPSNGGHWRLQLDVLGAAGEIALDVPRVDRRDRALNQSHVLLRHRLPPFLREAFGGSTGLVDVGDRKACDQASYPDEDPSLALSKVTGAASRTTVLNDHGKYNPIAEVADSPQARTPTPRRRQTSPQGSYEWPPVPRMVPQRPPVEGRIFGEAAGHRVEIATIRRLERPAHKLHQVGGRGLLRQHAAKYPRTAASAARASVRAPTERTPGKRRLTWNRHRLLARRGRRTRVPALPARRRLSRFPRGTTNVPATARYRPRRASAGRSCAPAAANLDDGLSSLR